MIHVTVPATSANLGSGFDSMGVALRLYNVISMCESDTIDIRARNGYQVRCDATNLIYKTVAHVYELCGKKLTGLKLLEDSNIPKTRGLGSSSACIVAGILGANEMLKRPLSRCEMINLAAILEGHPDNSTPAMLGGVTVSVLENGHVYYSQVPVKERLTFVALIPQFHLETGRARAALPEEVAHADARFNLSRAALLTASLAQGKLRNLKVAMEDQLHQQHRFEMIPDGRAIYDKLYQNGALGVYISGAGPTLIAVVRASNQNFIRKIKGQMKEEYPQWRILPLQSDERGARIYRNKKHPGRS